MAWAREEWLPLCRMVAKRPRASSRSLGTTHSSVTASPWIGPSRTIGPRGEQLRPGGGILLHRGAGLQMNPWFLCVSVSLNLSKFLSLSLSLSPSISLTLFLSFSLAHLLSAVFILLTPNHCISFLSLWTQRLAGWKWLGYLCESSYDCVHIHICAQNLRCTWTPELEVLVTAQHVHFTDFCSYYCHCLE